MLPSHVCFRGQSGHDLVATECFGLRWASGGGAFRLYPPMRAVPTGGPRCSAINLEGRFQRPDAIGAKRTCREHRERVNLTKMTRSGHWHPNFTVLHNIA
jgi:hypothetical protein